MRRGRKPVVLRYGESVLQQTLDLAAPLAKHGSGSLYLRIALDVGGKCVSEDTVFLTSPRFLALPRGRVAVRIRLTSPTRALFTFASPVFQHRFAFDLRGVDHQASDNYFELYPGKKKTVTVEFTWPQTTTRLKRQFTYQSLADTY